MCSGDQISSIGCRFVTAVSDPAVQLGGVLPVPHTPAGRLRMLVFSRLRNYRVHSNSQCFALALNKSLVRLISLNPQCLLALTAF